MSTSQIKLIRRKNMFRIIYGPSKPSKLYYAIKTHKCKSIQGEILQNDTVTIINVSKPNYLNGRPIIRDLKNRTQDLSSVYTEFLQ